MIGMKWVDRWLVDNPDAQWAIDNQTCKAIHDLLGRAGQRMAGQEKADSIALS